MKWLCYIAIAFVVFCVGGITGCLVERNRARDVEVVQRCDTVVRVDTVMLRVPVPVPGKESTVRNDTVWLPRVDSPDRDLAMAKTDTVVVHDSVQVVVPITQKVYEDSMYRAWVSGYRPALDSIEVYSHERTITQTVEVTQWKQKRWHLGVTAGYGYSFDGFRPYVGVGLTYSLVGF